MREPFTIQRSHVAATEWFALKREIFSYTGNEQEASSILRNIERLGSDRSIDHYEITPNANDRVYPGAAEVIWKVRPVSR